MKNLGGDNRVVQRGLGAFPFFAIIQSRLSRCSTARGSSAGLFCVGPTKVGACKSFLFIDGPLKVENKVENEKIISQFVGTSKMCDGDGDWVSKTN